MLDYTVLYVGCRGLSELRKVLGYPFGFCGGDHPFGTRKAETYGVYPCYLHVLQTEGAAWEVASGYGLCRSAVNRVLQKDSCAVCDLVRSPGSGKSWVSGPKCPSSTWTPEGRSECGHLP